MAALSLRTIDITTTQKVTINYELSTLGDRVLAFVIDGVVGFLLVGLLMGILTAVDIESSLVYYVVFAPLVAFYTLAQEVWTNGQTLGKRAMNIKVVKISGVAPSFEDFFVRWAFRLADIWFSLGALACILISSSGKSQRLGDIVANTAVVRTRSRLMFNLDDILNIHTLDNYVVTYAGVRQFSEKDMLLVKQVLTRYEQYANKAHEEALHDVVRVVCGRMNIEEPTGNKVNFLRTLIGDYIVLTR